MILCKNINVDLAQIFNIDGLQILLMVYADDAVVFAKSAEVLQSISYDIESYCTLWGIKLYTAKTKAMIFER